MPHRARVHRGAYNTRFEFFKSWLTAAKPLQVLFFAQTRYLSAHSFAVAKFLTTLDRQKLTDQKYSFNPCQKATATALQWTCAVLAQKAGPAVRQHKPAPDHHQKGILKMAISTVNQSELTAKLQQLGALLAQAHGGGLEAFEGLTSAARDNYLAACAGLVDNCLELADTD